jgi:HlyD family secretion protein
MIDDAKPKGLLKKLKGRKRFLALIVIGLVVAAYFVWPGNESIYVGTIEVTEVDVAARVHSQIAKRIMDEGDVVKAGDPLYQLTCEDQVVDLAKARNDFERAEKLLRTGNMSFEQFDTYKKQYDLTSLNVGWCDVRSPIDGTILTKFHEGGDYVYTGTKLMAMGDLNDVWAYVYVDQPYLASISIGQDVSGVLPELKDKLIPGRVIHIKDEAEFTPKNVQTRKERTRLVYGVKIKFDNSEKLLKPGMPIEVRFARLQK